VAYDIFNCDKGAGLSKREGIDLTEKNGMQETRPDLLALLFNMLKRKNDKFN
jgi:hypothetical protein